MYVLAIETTGAYASVALAESRHAKADPAQWENAPDAKMPKRIYVLSQNLTPDNIYKLTYNRAPSYNNGEKST